MPLRQLSWTVPDWMQRLSWQTAVIALVSGGIIHIGATLAMPRFATASGVQRLAAALPVNRMLVLPPATAEQQPLPYQGPDVRLAVCRYDVSDGPVSISAVLPDKGWSLAIYSMQGDNFYVVPAQDLRRAEISFQLVPQSERFLGIFSAARGLELTASQITVPEARGVIVVRAPLRGRTYQSETDGYLQRAQCAGQRG